MQLPSGAGFDFPDIEISPEASEELQRLTLTLVRQTITEFMAFSVERGGKTDAMEWTEICKRGSLRVYKHRPQAEDIPIPLPALTLHGSMDGVLDEIMYSVMTPNEEILRVRAKYMEDSLLDAKVLHPIVEASVDDPMRHLAVTWSLHTHSFALPTNAEKRDFVGITATGIIKTQSKTGKRIGYKLFHSVDFFDFPHFNSHGITRSKMSVCAIYKEKSPSQIECFVRGFFDFPPNEDELPVHVIANQWLVAMNRECEFARTKKLMWWLRNATSSIIKQYKWEKSPAPCAICDAVITVPNNLHRRKRKCMGCHHSICSRCSISKSLFVYTTETRSVRETTRLFCSKCLVDVNQYEAVVIAQEEVLLDVATILYKYSVLEKKALRVEEKRKAAWTPGVSRYRSMVEQSAGWNPGVSRYQSICSQSSTQSTVVAPPLARSLPAYM